MTEEDLGSAGGPADAAAARASSAGEVRAIAALDAAGLTYRLVRHGPVASLAEAAQSRGVEPRDVVKTLVVRRSAEQYLFVLVPGDRTISWPKLRDLLGVSRLSMPDAATALATTGYERGTITPFGSATGWPVIADERVRGRTISLGAGAHGVAVALDADAAVAALGATLADVTEPDNTEPDVIEPDVTEPDVTESDNAESDNAEPDATG